MKAIFDTQKLSHALEQVQSAAQTKVTSNTNNGFFISLKEGKAEFQANDYSIGIASSCDADIKEEGTVVIVAPQLLNTIKLLPQGLVTMKQKNGESLVHFSIGSYNAAFPTKEFDEFPQVKKIDHQNHVLLSCKEFIEMVNQVSFAGSNDIKNPMFTGVLCEIKDNSVTFVATNAHQLATKKIAINQSVSEQGRFIIPIYALQDVIRLLPSEEDATIEISWANRHVAFAFEDTYFISTLINGEYPKYEKVFPDQFHLKVELELKEFIEAVRFVSTISRDLSYKTINFRFADNTLCVYEEDPDIGRSETSIPAVMDGENVKITFNYTYVENILKHSIGDKIILHVMKNGPMVVEQEKDKDFRYVVTPIKGLENEKN